MRSTVCLVLMFVSVALVHAADAGNIYRDSVTGYEIVNLTSESLKAGNLYNHFSNFTADNKYIIFAGTEAGKRFLYRYGVSTRQITQLTNDESISAGTACPDPYDARRIYVTRGPEILALDVQTKELLKVGAVPGEIKGGLFQPTVNRDGTWITTGKQVDEKTWEIGMIHAKTGEYRRVIQQGFRIGHILHSPTDPIIFYVWETGGYAPQRTWLVNEDGSGNRPFYAPVDHRKWWTPLKEWVTHEVWVQGTGDMTMINDKLGIMLVKKDGSAKLVREGPYWHGAASPDGKYIALDDFEGRIWITEVATGNVHLLATGTHNIRMIHGHLSFDREGRYIQFQSGRTHETVSVIDLQQVKGFFRQ